MPYDPRCEELARYFLANRQDTYVFVEQLAQVIQDAIEDELDCATATQLNCLK